LCYGRSMYSSIPNMLRLKMLHTSQAPMGG